MKRYVTKLALLLLLLTLLMPGSLPTATAAPSSKIESSPQLTESSPQLRAGARRLKVFKQDIRTMDCGNFPASVCTPNGPNDPEDQEALIVNILIPEGATVRQRVTGRGHPPEYIEDVSCYAPWKLWDGHKYKQVEIIVQYPPGYNGGRSESVATYLQGISHRRKFTGLKELPQSRACSHTVQGTSLQQTKSSGRYNLTPVAYRCRNFEETWTTEYTVRNSARRTDVRDFSTGRVFLQVCYNGISAYLEGYETSFQLSNDASRRGFRPLVSNYETFITPQNSNRNNLTYSSIRIVFRPYYARPNAGLRSVGVMVPGVSFNAGWNDNGAEVRYTEYAINVDIEGCYIHSGGGDQQKKCPHGRLQ
ncbi:MAG: hypothetical protein AAGF95_10360 [Chloroflexota bacterium]